MNLEMNIMNQIEYSLKYIYWFTSCGTQKRPSRIYYMKLGISWYIPVYPFLGWYEMMPAWLVVNVFFSPGGWVTTLEYIAVVVVTWNSPSYTYISCAQNILWEYVEPFKTSPKYVLRRCLEPQGMDSMIIYVYIYMYMFLFLYFIF